MLIVLVLGDPRSGEGAEGSESGGTLPDGVLSVGRGNDSDLGTTWGEGGDLGLQSVGNTLVHGGTTGHDDVLQEVLSDIDVGAGDGLPGEGLDAIAGLAVEVGLEDKLGDLHTDGTGDGDLASIWESVRLVELGRGLSGGVLGSVVLSDEGELLLDILDDFELGGGGERVSSLEKELLGVFGDDTTSDLHLLNGVRDGETFEDGDGMGNTITGVDDETSGSTVGVEGHDGLDGDVHVLDLEGLEHSGEHALSVSLGVSGSFSDEDTLNFTGGDSELVVESVMPDLLHILPVGDDTVGDGVLEVEDTSLLLGFLFL